MISMKDPTDRALLFPMELVLLSGYAVSKVLKGWRTIGLGAC